MLDQAFSAVSGYEHVEVLLRGFPIERCIYEGEEIHLVSIDVHWFGQDFFWDAVRCGVLNLNALYKNFEDHCYQYHFERIQEVGLSHQTRNGLTTLTFFALDVNGNVFDKWQAMFIEAAN
ncbi:hypothetical protein [Geobacillus subterraneus]|uniref:Uncharacterized protein n=1 Tax=Geobacillus subterraneus TaxID=129338 RepID=A0A679FRY5_9BACL|nr:hypothetical protein [Geobacillus subterraneus]BBW98900.1 hypothetical protein GsuE55_37330 [Geobacillus subterraneus]